MPGDFDWEGLEEHIYELLRVALRREDCAARAAARLENDLVLLHEEDREDVVPKELPEKVKRPAPAVEELFQDEEVEGAEEGEEESEEGEVDIMTAEQKASREFSAGQFQSMFANLNLLRLVNDMVCLLELEGLLGEINSVLIGDMFRSRGSGGGGQVGRRGAEGEPFIGTDLDMLFEQLRRRAAAKQRGGGAAGR